MFAHWSSFPSVQQTLPLLATYVSELHLFRYVSISLGIELLGKASNLTLYSYQSAAQKFIMWNPVQMILAQLNWWSADTWSFLVALYLKPVSSFISNSVYQYSSWNLWSSECWTWSSSLTWPFDSTLTWKGWSLINPFCSGTSWNACTTCWP